MERIINTVPAPIRRFISRGLSFPTLSRLTSSGSLNGADQSPLPSAGKRQREASDDEGDGNASKRVKMDVDTPATVGDATSVPESPGAVEQIRPGVEAMSIGDLEASPSANGSAANTASVEASPVSPKRAKYQRPLRGTRKPAASDATSIPTPSKPRLGPKRKCALLIGFCGAGYSGMQIQKDANTIEGNLFDALVKAGAVSDDNSDEPTKVDIQRSARTDAGVHAARNVVSIKIIINLPGVTDLVGLINSHLPPQIRIWDIVRTQSSFNSRLACDSRKYTYFLPTYMLLPPAPDSQAAHALRGDREHPYDPSEHAFWKSVAGQPITPETTLFMLRKKWHIDPDTLEKFKAILEMYIGTHNFWNFTVGHEFKEAASKRHIISIQVEEPAIYGDTEWLCVQIHGQSFMYHQRKMIGLAVLLARSQGSPSLVNNLYTQNRVHIPKSPALGLLLEEPVFERYNKKIATANAKWKDAASSGGKETDDDAEHVANFIREPVDFEKHQSTIEEFKQNYIYDAMRKTEEEQGTFDAWLTSIDNHEARLFYELRGVPVPSELGGSAKTGTRLAAAVKDGDESDDALSQGKVNFKSVELEG